MTEWSAQNDAPDAPDLWREIAGEIAARRALVAATVVRNSGSVPRRVGAKMLVYADGRTRGTVGGGLFEALIVRDALEALANAQSTTRAYSFNPVEPERACSSVADSDAANNSDAPRKAKRAGVEAFGAVCGGQAEVFLEVIMPDDRLLIVGGGHCGRALARAAALLDFSVVVADDRAEFARVEDFPFANVESVLHLPDNFAGLPDVDERTFVVLVSKGFVTDEAALRRVLDSHAAYIGMIGSKRKREVVFDRLRADGIASEKLACVHAPIGLEIGAETPEEIAVSILAEIIAVRARRRNKTARVQREAQPVSEIADV